MRTLLLAPALFASEGGIERMMRLYLKGLCELGPAGSVTVAALNDGSIADPRFSTYATAALRHRIAGRRRRWRFALQVLTQARSVDRIVCGHLHLWPLVRLAQRLNPQLHAALVAHGMEAWRPWSRQEQQAMASGRVWAVSRYTRERILDRCPALPPDRVTLLPNALDPTLARVSAAPVQPGRLVTLARLSRSDRYKGIDHLIRALPLVRATVPEAHLRVIGDGDDRADLEALAQETIAGGVSFAGFVPDSDLPRELAQAQLFALPSRDEGFGLAYLEALAAGKPCVAARSGGTPDVITPEVGQLVPYGDIPALAAALTATLRRPWDVARLRAQAEAFSYSTFRDRLGRALAALPGRNPRTETISPEAGAEVIRP